MSEFKRNLAVVIGINNYQNGIAHLKTAVADAVAIASILKDSYQYQLIHPDFDTGVIVNQYATRDRLKHLFTEILPHRIKPTQSDRLLLYFAGHGIARSSDVGPEGYLIPHDGNINNHNSLLRMGDLHDWLSKLECRHLLVILDCCFAGTFRWASTRKLIPIPEKIHWEHYYRFIKYPAWQVITSAAYNQEALDLLNNRDVDQIKQHSPFAEGLIKALGDGQADLIADGVITTPELYLYLRDYVELNSQARQTPGFFPLKKHDRGEYIFNLPNIKPQLQPAPKLEKDNNPYRGLESFNEKHSHFFFGRQEVIQDLFTKVTEPQQQLTVVLGISGSGKSSLVKAGLIPYLRQNQAHKWQILSPIRPGSNPYRSLARALLQLKSNATNLEKQLPQNPQESIKLLQTWSQQHSESRLLLVIDQFEELITLGQTTISVTEKPQLTWWKKFNSKLALSGQVANTNSREEKKAEWHKFITLLADILKQCPQLSLILTLRSDFEPRFLNSALQSQWSNSRFVVRAMRSDELRDVVEKPATEMALYFEPANLVDRLVDEVAPMPGALPLLSFTLSERYIKLHRAWLEEGREDRALSVDENFDQQGGVAGSLTRRANQEYDHLPDKAHRSTMSRVMLRMVEIEGAEAVKRRVLKPELIYPSEPENQRVERVLKSLVDTRLIVTGKEAESDNVYYEPAHDFLVRGWDKLQNWLQKGQQQDNLALQRLLTPAAFEWEKQAKSRLFLWNSNPRLDLLNQVLHAEDNGFNRVETEFVQSSVARKKFNVRLRWGSAVAVIILLSTGLIFALLGQRNAKIGQSNASKESARASLIFDQSLDGMINSLKAGTALEDQLLKFWKPSRQLQQQVAGTLQWSVYQVKEINRMQENTEDDVPVRSIFSPDGNLLASAEENGWVRLWNLQGQELASWQGDQKRVWNVAFSPDGNLLAGATESGEIKLWNLQGQELASWQAHRGQTHSLSFSKDGQLIASAGWDDGTIGLWNLQGTELGRWQAYTKTTRSVNFSPDNQLISTTGVDTQTNNTIRIWNLQGNKLQEFSVDAWKVLFSPDGQLIASAGDDGFIRIWNQQYQPITSWQADRQRLWNLAFSSDSQLIASAGEDGSARVWNLQGQQLSKFKGHTGPVRSVSFSKDSKLLASSGDDDTTRLWTLQDRELAKWQGDNNLVHDLVFSPDGQLLLGSGAEDGTVDFQNLEKNSVPQQPLEFKENSSPITSISLSPDGQLLASISSDGIVYIRNLQGKLLLSSFSTQINSPKTIIFSPDSKLLAIGGRNGQISLWNLQGELITKLPGQRSLVNSLSFSPDGKFLASAAQDGTVITWDWQHGRAVNQSRDHVGAVYTVAFSPNGKFIASGGQDGTVRILNLPKNSTKSPLHIDQAEVTSVKFSPDGKTIISGDDQGSVQIWDIRSGTSLATWKAHQDGIDRLSINQDGNLLATAGQTGEVKLWRIDSFEQLLSQVCSLMSNYLQHNSTLEQSDRDLCHNIP